MVVEGARADKHSKYADAQGWDVMRVARLADAVRRCDQGAADVLLVENPYDLWADIMDLLRIKDRSRRQGWRIATPDGLDTSRPGDAALFTMLHAVNTFRAAQASRVDHHQASA